MKNVSTTANDPFISFCIRDRFFSLQNGDLRDDGNLLRTSRTHPFLFFQPSQPVLNGRSTGPVPGAEIDGGKSTGI